MEPPIYSKPIVILAKFFGVLHLKCEEDYLSKSLTILLSTPVIIIYAYAIYMNAYQIDYTLNTKLVKMINTLYLLLASCAVIFKYSYYLVRSQTIWNVLGKISALATTSRGGGGTYEKSRKSWLIFTTISFGVVLLDFGGVAGSKLDLPLVWTIFHSLYQQHIFVELYVIGAFLAELLKAYTDVNNSILVLMRAQNGCGSLTLRKWKILSEYHTFRQRLNSLSRTSNAVFMPGLAANIMIEFYFLVGACHLCFLHFLIGYQMQEYNVILMAWMGFIILVKTGYILQFIKVWIGIINEAEKTVSYIHDIWNDLASRNEITCNAKHLQLIVLQLYNTKLSFTASGLVAIDWTLLHRVISSVATYVIILIQFEISSMIKCSNSVYNVTTELYIDQNSF